VAKLEQEQMMQVYSELCWQTSEVFESDGCLRTVVLWWGCLPLGQRKGASKGTQNFL